MTVLYRTSGAFWRHNISLAILIVVGVYGIWELWRAYTTDAAQWDWMFAIAFTAGSAYGFWQLLEDTKDRVITFERDEATGTTVTTLWRPFIVHRLKGEPSRLSDWRFHVKVGARNSQTYFIYANHKDHPRPLQFELGDRNDHAGLRGVAPEAVAEFERRVGLTPPAAD